MKKAILIIVSLILIFSGIYGTYYFSRIQSAEDSINSAILELKSGNYDKATVILKNVIANYDYCIVRFPSLYLTGRTFEEKKNYKSALAAYKEILLSEKEGILSGNWKYLALISVSRLYRNNLVQASETQKTILEKYIIKVKKGIEEKLKQEKESKATKTLKNFYKNILTLNYSLNIKDKTLEEILIDLETELGFLYIATGDLKSAQSILSNLNNFDAKYGLSTVLYKLGKKEEAIKLLESIMDEDATGKIKKEYIEKSYNYAVNLYKNKNYTRALKYFKKISGYKEFPEYYENSLYYIGNYYFSKGNLSSALYYFKKIISNSYNIKDEEGTFNIGLIYYDKKDYIHAYKTFREFIKSYPRSKKINDAKSWMDICERSIKYFN